VNPGRCAGCGKTSTSCKSIRNHVTQCPKYALLYREHPELCLDPVDEFERNKAYEASDEGQDARAEAKSARLDKRFAEMDRAREAQDARWSGAPDILA
jgi:predicted ATPase with chaperone activity